MTDRVGQQIGNYRLLRLLGVGGFAEVYLGEHVYLGSQAAVKILHTRVAQGDIGQFQQEGRILASLMHTHIVRVLEFGTEQEMPYLITDYAPGGTLRTQHPKGTRIPLTTVIQYAKQMGQALQYAHDRKCIHRDIKPDNMLVGRNGEILLSDFGIALIAHSSRYQSKQDLAGTIAYMAPEQIAAHPRPASDQYSLGVVIYEWLSGTLPFRGTMTEMAIKHSVTPPPSLCQLVPSLSPAVEQVIFTALAKEPTARFISIRAFVTALEQASQERQAEPQYAAPLYTKVPPLERALPDQQEALILPKTASAPMVAEHKTLPPVMPTIPSDQQPLPLTVTPRLPKRSIQQIVLFVALAVLLIGGGGYTYSAVGTYNQQVQATAAALAPTATTRATMTAYNQYVEQHGIMFGFDAGHSRTNPYEHIISAANVSQLHQKWAGTIGSSIESSPVVANGIIYVGSADSKLYAFDALTGQLKWTASTQGAIYGSSPAVANGLAYIGSWDGRLYAFDALTGQLKWAAATGYAIYSSPVVANGIVYVGSWDHKLYAFDALAGQLKWTAPTGNYISSSPAVANGVVYVGSFDSKLYAFDALTGLLKWATSTGGPIDASSPAVANGIVYVGSDNHKLYAFDALTGQLKWSASTGNMIRASPAVANGIVYVGSDDHKFYAFDALTGQLKWSASTGEIIRSSSVAVNGIVYVGSWDNKLYAFDALTGLLKWFVSTGGHITSSPAVAYGVLYAGTWDHKLYAFGL